MGDRLREYPEEFRQRLIARLKPAQQPMQTLVSFTTENGFKRYALLGLESKSLGECWLMYKEEFGNDQEEFMLLIIDITKHEVPRLYVNVEPLELN